MANSLHYNGIDLSGGDYGVTLMKQRTAYPVMTRPKIFSASVAQRAGGFTYGGRGTMRVIPVRVAVQGSSFADLMTKIDNLNYVMAPENGEKSIRFDYVAGRYWMGRLNGEIQAPPIGATSVTLNWDFLCSDPNAYSTTEVTQTLTISTSPQTFDLPAASGTTIDGNVETFPVWTIQHLSFISALSVTINNTTSGQIITVSKALHENDYLRINSATELIEYSEDGIIWVNTNAGRDNTNKTFPTLKPRVQNSVTITITGVVDATCEVVYRARYRS